MTNQGHRPKGHKTRGIHKRVMPGSFAPRDKSIKRDPNGWTPRKCPKCGKKIMVKRWVTQAAFKKHVKECTLQ